MSKLGVCVIGCGQIGSQRAKVARESKGSSLKMVVDLNLDKARTLARKMNCSWGTRWEKAISDSSVNTVIVSTPHHFLSKISCAALHAGKNVLVEKPMGLNWDEAQKIVQSANKSKGKLKVGFNHRYHPAIFKAHQIYSQGTIGPILNIRSRYGHGGRIGYEKEWRSDPYQSGGGELIDQGSHVIDLIQWFCGQPSHVFSFLQTGFWKIGPLEDNAFGLLKYKNGIIAQFHTSWTQWKNLFNFEVLGTRGMISVEGLGGNYGPETLTVSLIRKPGQVPKSKQEVFNDLDRSWNREWDDFVQGIRLGDPYWGSLQDGISVMRILKGLYESNRAGKIVPIK